MRVDEAEGRLRAMLQEAGLDPGRLQPDVAWPVFKAFAAERVEGLSGDDDMCLFECGVYDWSDGNGPRFNWGLTRQFTLYDKAVTTTTWSSCTAPSFSKPPHSFIPLSWMGSGRDHISMSGHPR